MLKKFLIGICTFFFMTVGAIALVGYAAHNAAPANKAAAEAILRDVAKSWNADDLALHFERDVVRQIDFGAAQTGLGKVRPLGSLKRVLEASQQSYNWSAQTGKGTKTTATIEMLAEFENGRARVTMHLVSEGGTMKLRHVNVVPVGPIRPSERI